MGNTVGKIGNGERILVYDSHIDTVGIGAADEWDWDPFEGKVEDGILYARGACDEKGSTPGMIYGLAIARSLGLLDGWTAYYFGNMEEWCDGIAPHAFVEHEGIRPDFVVIGEPTKMQIYRGHKGRVELKAVAKGRSAHAASNHLGDNAIYKALPLVEGISRLEPQLGNHPFLGPGKITATDIEVETPSLNAVPNQCTVYIDRRVTFGEDLEAVIEQVRGLIPQANQEAGDVTLEMLYYDDPSYTGFVFPVEKYFPAWALEDERTARAGRTRDPQTHRSAGRPHRQVGFQHQRHLLARQGRHSQHRFRPRRRSHRPHRPRQRPPGRCRKIHRVLRTAAGLDQIKPTLLCAAFSRDAKPGGLQQKISNWTKI